MATLLAAFGFLENDYAASVKDATGNNHDGLVVGSVAFEAGPQTDSRALRFTDIDQAVNIDRAGLEPSSSGGGVVAMGWYRSFGSGQNCGVLVKMRTYSPASTRCGITVNANGTVFFVARWKDDLHYGEYGSGMNDGNWHHTAIVDGDTEWAFYIDGALVDGGSRAFNQSSSPTWEDFPWTIGYVDGLSESSNAFTVSDARLFSGTMTQSEVQVYMNESVSLQTIPTPMAAFSFEQNSGATTYDNTDNGHDGVATDSAILNGSNVTFTETGQAGGAGIHQSVIIPRINLEPFLAYTLMASAKMPAGYNADEKSILVKPRGNQSTGAGLYFENDTTLFYVVSVIGGDRSYGNITIPSASAAWHHYALTVSAAGDWVVYSDGVVLQNGYVAPLGSFIGWSNYPWSVGYNAAADLGGNETGMQVDDVRIFSQALTQAEVQYYMNNPVIPRGRKMRMGGSPIPLKLGSNEKFFG